MQKHTWTLHFKLYAEDDRVELPVALRVRDTLRKTKIAGVRVALDVFTSDRYFSLTVRCTDEDTALLMEGGVLRGICGAENIFFDHASCRAKKGSIAV